MNNPFLDCPLLATLVVGVEMMLCAAVSARKTGSGCGLPLRSLLEMLAVSMVP